MAVANLGSGSEGRRRSLDSEVNLVPFIDLLSMCICFLLMTAVWTQLGALEVRQATGTEADAQAKTSLDLEARFLRADQLQVTLKQGAKALKSFVVAPAELGGQLSAVGGPVGSVRITPKEGVSYGELVAVMDTFRKNKMANIGIVPVVPAGEK